MENPEIVTDAEPSDAAVRKAMLEQKYTCPASTHVPKVAFSDDGEPKK